MRPRRTQAERDEDDEDAAYNRRWPRRDSFHMEMTDMAKSYSINECFYSLQGEGARQGTANVFLRFAGCNLQCVDAAKLGRPLKGREIDAGFHCDTDFAKGKKLSREDVVDLVKRMDLGNCRCIILTGGEPTLQVDKDLVHRLKEEGFHLAIETNGLEDPNKVLPLMDWISCSPKAGTEPALKHASEVRVVLKEGEPADTRGLKADYLFVSPANDAPTADKISGFKGSASDFSQANMAWAVQWCLANPEWRVSLQMHKILGVR